MHGAPDAPAVVCVATQDELVSLDNAVATEGGTARAFMDDVAVVATPRTGFMAIAEYMKNIGRTAGVRIEKVEQVYTDTRLGSTLELSRQAPIASRQRERAVSSSGWGAAGPPLVFLRRRHPPHARRGVHGRAYRRHGL